MTKYIAAIELVNALSLSESLINDIRKIQHKEQSQRLKVYSDLLMRVHNNLYTISSISINEKSYASLNLIYRNIVVDIYWLEYFSFLNDGELIEICDSLNADHAKFLKTHSHYMYKLFYDMDKTDTSDSSQHFLDKLFDKFKDYLDNAKGEHWKVKTFGNKSKNESVHVYFKDNHDDKFYLLYIVYRFLSQTEHYAPISISYAFPKMQDADKIYMMYNAIIHDALRQFSNHLNRKNND